MARQYAIAPLGFLLLTLTGCQSLSLSFKSVDSVKQLSSQIQNAHDIEDVKAIASQAKVSRQLIRADIKRIKALYAKLDQRVNKKWGKRNSELPEKKKYVKYTNDYQARTVVNFEKGTVRVETLTTNAPIATLKNAVTTTLLTTADPTKTDIFSSDTPNTEGVPFLYPQVVDQDGTVVQYRWRAERYADYLSE